MAEFATTVLSDNVRLNCTNVPLTDTNLDIEIGIENDVNGIPQIIFSSRNIIHVVPLGLLYERIAGDSKKLSITQRIHSNLESFGQPTEIII